MRYAIALLVTVLMITAFTANALKIDVGNIDKAFEKIYNLTKEGKLPEDALNAVLMHKLRFTYRHHGNFTGQLQFKGVLNNVFVTIYGNGTKLAHLNNTSMIVDNGTVFWLNFTYYPRNVTVKFEGYEVNATPSQNPKLDINNDGVWDVEYIGNLTNGSSSPAYSLGDLNLTNQMKVYVNGSSKVILNFTWYDEGRLFVKKIVCGGAEVNVSRFIASGENYTVTIPNVTDVIPPVEVTIIVDDDHTLCIGYNYTMEFETYPFMLLSDSTATISPSDGCSYDKYKPTSNPIPVFVKPRYQSCSVRVNVYNPNASTADVYLNVTIESASGNVVDFILTNVSADSLDVYIDGEYYTTIQVENGVCNFTMDRFSTHNLSFVVSGALAVAPEEIDWQWVAGIIMFAVLVFVLIYLLVATLRGR